MKTKIYGFGNKAIELICLDLLGGTVIIIISIITLKYSSSWVLSAFFVGMYLFLNLFVIFGAKNYLRFSFKIIINEDKLSVIWPKIFRKKKVDLYYDDISEIGVAIRRSTFVTFSTFLEKPVMQIYFSSFSPSENEKNTLFYTVPNDKLVWCSLSRKNFELLMNRLPDRLSEQLADKEYYIDI